MEQLALSYGSCGQASAKEPIIALEQRPLFAHIVRAISDEIDTSYREVGVQVRQAYAVSTGTKFAATFETEMQRGERDAARSKAQQAQDSLHAEYADEAGAVPECRSREYEAAKSALLSSDLRPPASYASHPARPHDSRMFEMVAVYAQRGSDKELNGMIDLAELFVERVMLAFDELHEGFQTAVDDLSHATAKRNAAREELEALAGKTKENKTGVLLALPALFAAAMRATSDVVIKDRRWSYLMKAHASTGGLSFADQYDILSTSKHDQHVIPLFDEATSFIWGNRFVIKWPAIPQPLKHSWEEIVRGRPNCAMLLQAQPALGLWGRDALQACRIVAVDQSKRNKAEVEFFKNLSFIVSKLCSELGPESEEKEEPFYIFVCALLGLTRIGVNASAFSYKKRPIGFNTIRRFVSDTK